MNKTVVFITFAALAGLGLIGSAILLIHRPDATATFTNFVIQILGIATIAAGTFYSLGKTNEKIDAVSKQTNGTLSKKDEEITRLREEIADLNRQIHPDTDGR